MYWCRPAFALNINNDAPFTLQAPTYGPWVNRACTLRGRRRDGIEFPAEIRLSPVEIDGKLMVWATIRDVSERERLISQLRSGSSTTSAAAERAPAGPVEWTCALFRIDLIETCAQFF